MARVLTSETSLEKAQRELEQESRLLSFLRRIEWPLTALLLAGGLALFFWRGSPGLLIAGGLVAFLALGHHFKGRENRIEERIIGVGRSGEAGVCERLAESLSEDAAILNDVELRIDRRRAQVDHLVVAPNGIFVVETKNWGGKVSGNEEDAWWHHQRHENARPHRVKSPIYQCRRQAKFVRRRLENAGIDWPDVHPMIVMFSPRTKLETGPLKTPVTNLDEAIRILLRHQGGRVYTREEIDRVTTLFTGKA